MSIFNVWKWFAVAMLLVVVGCENIVFPGVVGKWELEGVPSNKIEFFSDGTLRETALLNTSNGKYMLLSGNRLKMEIDGIMWGTNVTTFNYTVSGDRLTLVGEEGVALSLNWRKVH